MFKYLCPKCKKNCYSADEEYFSPCPYCGFRFSGKYGYDRRQDERIKKEAAIVLAYQEQHFEAKLTDFSKEGLGIKIFGETSVTIGKTVEISTSDLLIKAKVMWVNKAQEKSIVGLQKLN